jgi:hypothetical protein
MSPYDNYILQQQLAKMQSLGKSTLDNKIDLSSLQNDLGIVGTAINIADSLNNAVYNSEKQYNNLYDDIAMRGTAEDRTVGNGLKELILTGNGLWGQTSEDKEIQQAVDWRKSQAMDFSNVKNNANMENAWYQFSPKLDYITPNQSSNPRQIAVAYALNKAGDYAYNKSLNSFYDAVGKNDATQLRNNLYNVFAEGGYMPADNNITMFNVGGTHQQNPYDGIQQGIAYDGKPNLVEEGEIKYKDYIYSARNKVSESLLKKYNLPEKYAGKKFAEVAEKLQKESESRPNDPISNSTLDEMMGRLANAQEEYNAKKEERLLNRFINSLSPEDKSGLAQMIPQQLIMQPQEEFNPSLEQYASGGKIYIKPENRGKFTALKERTGHSATWFKEHGTPEQKKMATFALNAKKWKHGDGGHLLQNGGVDSPYWGLEFVPQESYETTPLIKKEYIPLNILQNPSEVLSPWKTQEDLNTFYKDEFTKYWNSLPKNERNGSNVNKAYLTGQQARNFVRNLRVVGASDGEDATKAEALAHMLMNQWGDKDTDWSDNATWEFKNKYNPTGTIAETSKYLEWAGDNTLMKDGLFGIKHAPALLLLQNPLYKKSTIPKSRPEYEYDIIKKSVKDDVTTTKKDLSNIKDNPLRYAQLLSGLGAFTSPTDFTYANELDRLAGMYTPIAAPALGGYRRYNPYDVNLANNEGMAQLASMQRANRENTNRAAQTAANIATFNAYSKDNAARNLQWQQANEANRLATDQYNLGIDQANINLAQEYDKINSAINDKRVNMLAQAAQARDNATSITSQNRSQAVTNLLNSLAAIGKENYQYGLINKAIEDGAIEGFPYLLSNMFGKPYGR